jgi:hypothetical protein
MTSSIEQQLGREDLLACVSAARSRGAALLGMERRSAKPAPIADRSKASGQMLRSETICP